MNIRRYQDKTPLLGKDSYIDETAVIIGDVEIGNQCSIWPYAVIRGDVHKIRIGDKSNIQDGCVLHVTHINPETNPTGCSLTIGEEVTIGHKATLHGCTIGNRVLVGIGSIILDNAIIDDDVIIGAGTLVPPRKHLISGHLYVGNPARQVRPLTDQEKESLRYGANHYIKLKNTYQQS